MSETETKTNSVIFNTLEKYVMNPLGKMSQTRFVRAIMATGHATIPLTIVGSMFLVLNILPMAIPGLQGFFDQTFFKFSDLYMLANKATMGVLAIYFNLVLGYEYTRIIAQEEDLPLSGIMGGVLSLMAFFMTVPQLVWDSGVMSLVHEVSEDVFIINGWEIGGDGVSRFSSGGIFVGIIMAVLAVHIYKFAIEKEITIKMPDAVPLGVSRSFEALIPTFFISMAVMALNAVFIFLGTDFYTALTLPFGFVTNLTSSWGGMVVIYFLIQAMWSVGIHGATIINNLITPIMLVNMAENAAGAAIPFAGEFSNSFGYIGGSGATLGLTLFLAFFAQSEQLKVLGKSAIVPGIFNINEPIIFGVPMIYNPDMLIPFILAPITGGTVGYFGLKLGFVNPIIAKQPWPTPIGIGGFIATGGDWKAIILAVLSAVVAFLTYYPFIKRYDAKLAQEELENAHLVNEELSDDEFFAL